MNQERAPGELNDLGEVARDAHSWSEAAELFRRAAERGLPVAQNNLGALYDTGRGVPQDRTKAANWYRTAAEAGDPLGQANLARFYYKGAGGLPLDHGEAAKWWRRAAEAGDADSQYCLAQVYSFGEGVPQDHAEAMKWYRRAAEQGHIESQYNLGACHWNGLGVSRDTVEAVKWFRQAAVAGHAGAQRALVVCEEDAKSGGDEARVEPSSTPEKNQSLCAQSARDVELAAQQRHSPTPAPQEQATHDLPGSAEPPTGRAPGSPAPHPDVSLQLRCNTCGIIYNVGIDSGLVTRESHERDIRIHGGFSVTLGARRPSTDTVMYLNNVATDQMFSRTKREVIRDLAAGGYRQWRCGKCGSVRDYPKPPTVPVRVEELEGGNIIVEGIQYQGAPITVVLQGVTSQPIHNHQKFIRWVHRQAESAIRKQDDGNTEYAVDGPQGNRLKLHRKWLSVNSQLNIVAEIVPPSSTRKKVLDTFQSPSA